MKEFFLQDVTVPAWAWFTTSACAIYCVLELACFLVRRKWKDEV